MTVRSNRPAARRLSRAFDVGVSLAALVLLAPLLAFCALLILLEDGTPVLFRQTRIGRHGEPFTILKFRSMRAGKKGIPITTSSDSRVTKVGSWLRALKFDELPQLMNVLQGSMSLIGPRPEVPEYVEFHDEIWRQVLEVRPGITDLASLAFRHEEVLLASAADPVEFYRSVVLPEKLRLNLQYHQSRSLVLDLKLLWMTARYSFFPAGFDRDRVLRALGASESAACTPANVRV